MKDEEMAEEYRKDLKSKFFLSEPQLDLACQGYKDGFLAGIKAGRPKWHDLLKDPKDLPDTDRIVYVQTKRDTGNAHHNNDGWHSTQVSGIVIAWCEIPTFDKE